MKSIIGIVVLFLAINQPVFSQLSQVFPTDSAYWELRYKCYDGGPQNVYYTDVTASFGNDTLIDNETYTAFTNPRAQGQTQPAYIRVAGDKVYYKRSSQFMDTATYLIFDFGLEAGDVFYYPDLVWSDSVIVQAVDSVTFLDGITRKRIIFQNPYTDICGPTDYWVEGIGGMPYPFYFDNHCFECMLSKFEFYQNDQLVVTEVLLDNNEVAAKEQEAIFIHPNPAKSVVFIESGDVSIKEYQIFDLTGREITRATINHNNFELHIPPSLTKGMYLLTLRLENNTIQIEKLLVD